MLSHRGFSAWITVDDKPLPEYIDIVDEDAHRVSCWIPGEEGQTFKVWWQDHGGKVDTCAFIILDGVVVPGRFLFGEGIASRSGIRASHMTEKPFMFTKVTQEGIDRREYGKDAGMIIVKIKRVKRTAPRSPNSVQKVGTVAASDKNPSDLSIGFGNERSTYLQYHATWDVKPYDNDVPGSDKPSTYVSFVFRYRSAEFLQAHGLSTEVKKSVAPVAPRVGQKRRVASLPPIVTGPLATPGPTPPKRPRLTEPFNITEPIHLPNKGAFDTRRPSTDVRRVVSLRGTPTQNVVIFPRPSKPILPSLLLQTLSTSSASSSASTRSDDDGELEELELEVYSPFKGQQFSGL